MRLTFANVSVPSTIDIVILGTWKWSRTSATSVSNLVVNGLALFEAAMVVDESAVEVRRQYLVLKSH
jgi:hypothetical protein